MGLKDAILMIFPKIFRRIHGLLASVHVAGVSTEKYGFTAVAVILAVASIPAAIDPAIDLAALTDVSVVAGVPAAANVTDNLKIQTFRLLMVYWLLLAFLLLQRYLFL
jgi:hypothetical protein